MRWARTGPTPGSWSSWVAVAVLRSIGAPGAGAPGGPAGAVGGTAGTGVASTPPRICSPSTTFRARLRVPVFAPGRAPPAALIASMTRAPAGRLTTPGWRTFPPTSTTSVVAEGLGGGPADASAAGWAAGRRTGWGTDCALGLDHQK